MLYKYKATSRLTDQGERLILNCSEKGACAEWKSNVNFGWTNFRRTCPWSAGVDAIYDADKYVNITELKTEISKDQFEELCLLLEPGRELIHKDYRAYRLEDGHILECSIVDGGAFSYAEVEFESEEAANAWQPIGCLGRETTYESGFKMKHYWHTKKKERMTDES